MKHILFILISMASGWPLIAASDNNSNAIDKHINDLDHLRPWQSKPIETRIISWNAFSRQFIDPPVFLLLGIPGTAAYTAEIQQGNTTWKAESRNPMVSLAEIWPKMANKTFSLYLRWMDKGGKILAEEKSIRVKAPDWAGLDEPDANWVAAAGSQVNRDAVGADLVGFGIDLDPTVWQRLWTMRALVNCADAVRGQDHLAAILSSRRQTAFDRGTPGRNVTAEADNERPKAPNIGR